MRHLTPHTARHEMWASVAPAWQEHADHVDERARLVTERLLALAQLTAGDRVLELACGPGGLGLAAARQVAPGGQVVLSDVTEQMIAVATSRARQQCLSNVNARVLDLEAIDEPDAAYDVALCRDGLMFAVDPSAAARELCRILRPGGRYALSVWGPRARNPWLSIVLDAISDELGVPVPPPGVPGPFSLEDAEELSGILAAAGLQVSLEEQPAPLRAASFEEWWTRTCALAGPVANLVAALDPGVAEAIRCRARAATAPYAKADGLEIPGVQLLVAGRRP